MKKLPLLIPFLLIVFVACKKEVHTNGFTNVTSTSAVYLLPIPTDASCVFYAINTIRYPNTVDLSDTVNSSLAGASLIKFGGTISVNGDTLSYSSDNFSTTYNTTTPPGFPTNNVVWTVQGNTANGVPSFNYTDNTAFPVVNGFSVPQNINMSSGVTLNYNITGAYDAIYYSLYGNNGGNGYTYKGGSNSTVSFSTVQLNQAVASGGTLSIQIILAKVTPYSVGGQTFYFVKESFYMVNTIAH